jgi:hypothetical protein
MCKNHNQTAKKRENFTQLGTFSSILFHKNLAGNLSAPQNSCLFAFKNGDVVMK